MSAILSADDLNDFISPGVACIKPVETLPKQAPETPSLNPYEVTTEDKVPTPAPAADAPPAQISLTDCLACSGCVTSAEAVLISLQSHEEVGNALDNYEGLSLDHLGVVDEGVDISGEEINKKLFVASVSPQTRASIAATYGVTKREAGNMITQLLSGPEGLKSTGKRGNTFTWVLDTNMVREICRTSTVQEALEAGGPEGLKRPILSSACPGWICYAEKTHPHILPHLSRLKSPQAMMGTLLKSVLSRKYGVRPDQIWHLAVMPCFDKKLEASREELTDVYWQGEAVEKRGVRDVDCVITARELVMLADIKGISFPSLPRTPVKHLPFPDRTLNRFLFPRARRRRGEDDQMAGPSGGWAYQIVRSQQLALPGSKIHVERGRNADVLEYVLTHEGATIAKTARYSGFQNITNLVRKLKPVKESKMPGAGRRGGAGMKASRQDRDAGMSQYQYVEVMACPGGCTNGGGQIKVSDVAGLSGVDTNGVEAKRTGPAEQKQWLKRVDEAYYSGGEEIEEEEPSAKNDGDAMDVDVDNDRTMNGHESEDEDTRTADMMQHWSSATGLPLDKLLYTTYRAVVSDVGKSQSTSDTDRVAGLAHSIGGGW